MDPTELIDCYCNVWNETDPELRANMLRRVWASGATYTDLNIHAENAEALLAHIANVQAKRPGARVVRTSEVDIHHSIARFGWRVIEADGAKLPESLDIAVLSKDGQQLDRIIGFFGPLAPEEQ